MSLVRIDPEHAKKVFNELLDHADNDDRVNEFRKWLGRWVLFWPVMILPSILLYCLSLITMFKSYRLLVNESGLNLVSLFSDSNWILMGLLLPVFLLLICCGFNVKSPLAHQEKWQLDAYRWYRIMTLLEILFTPVLFWMIWMNAYAFSDVPFILFLWYLGHYLAFLVKVMALMSIQFGVFNLSEGTMISRKKADAAMALIVVLMTSMVFTGCSLPSLFTLILILIFLTILTLAMIKIVIQRWSLYLMIWVHFDYWAGQRFAGVGKWDVAEE